MKGRIILYGWVASLPVMLIGLILMAWAMETGDPCFFAGLAMFMSFVVFSLLAIKYQKEVDEAVTEFDRWFDLTFGDER